MSKDQRVAPNCCGRSTNRCKKSTKCGGYIWGVVTPSPHPSAETTQHIARFASYGSMTHTMFVPSMSMAQDQPRARSDQPCARSAIRTRKISLWSGTFRGSGAAVGAARRPASSLLEGAATRRRRRGRRHGGQRVFRLGLGRAPRGRHRLDRVPEVPAAAAQSAAPAAPGAANEGEGGPAEPAQKAIGLAFPIGGRPHR